MRSLVRKPFIRILSVILIPILLLCFLPMFTSADAPKFSYTDAQDARLRALDCMMTCAFTQEWDSSGGTNTPNPLNRWETTIKICVTGSPSADDLQQLNAFIMEVATHCPNMPNIRIVYDERDANVTLYYGPLSTLSQHVDFYHEGNWGAFSYNYTDHRITKGKVGIATDVNTKASKRHLLREELVGVFGLCNDHYDYSDSILYQNWTTVPQLSEVDWLMLNMLYDRDLSCGMSASTAYSILYDKIMR